MARFGAYCLLACNFRHNVSSENMLVVQSKQAVSPKSGHEAGYERKPIRQDQ